ncbi:unnamed protein product [marine sediment metagenome]|uniref:Uncharacterized protein n=1 Tax=marine sediment metagenome TaxID=412755 RepID=X1NIC6_9ZZZZ
MLRDEVGILNGMISIIGYILVKFGIIEYLRGGIVIGFPRDCGSIIADTGS